MKYVIVGASAAGISAAKKLRELDDDSEITIISKDTKVYSRCMLHYLIGGQRDVEQLDFTPKYFFTENKINWLKGKSVTSVLPKQKLLLLEDGENVAYDKLLLATGASSFFPPINNLDETEGIYGLRNLDDALEIKEKAEEIQQAIVIGAGLVGVDAAIGLAELGVKVTIVEMADRILPLQLDAKAASRYQTRFEEKGIEIVIGARAKKVLVDDNNSVVGLELADDRIIAGELIVVATGIRPNIDLIKETDIEVDQGIVVNKHQQTNLEDIYAAGDVAQSQELFSNELTLTPIWPLATKQGEVAASNMAGISTKLSDNFAYQNSMRFLGLSTITYGLIEVEDDSYQILFIEDKDNYQKLILEGNKLKGAIFQGEIDGSGVYGRLIKDRIDLNDRLDNLFNLSYADFFKENKDGVFSY
ncbi:pyridine nucleotide-disulfide oxidoreductase [Orenia metallireducens]|jgi:NAD(P)H-nitrite reductase large subunit|uniref:Pyridine nucleotide-disulphide oxidoreductase n=1 Tax=Orenia metallireducens TaxID=1413210 RepID=A0A285G1S0_9FIRM|nr:FAD-dependent oxidoreductase [Orenia metallireducens]PRX31719.1 pyridine nucleotide-disulfide oxidoreductase [Orenia metallireducens]SNY17004.1 Pyridine nucleotide-disulphide oxidoreductase [Orenia metallireducens]